jgi:tryptophanyl-tRNA synthetase
LGQEAKENYQSQYLSSGVKYGELKEKLAKAIFQQLEPIQARRKSFEENPKLVKEILEEGRVYCSKIAQQTLTEVKKVMGLV